jgi:hypothetical protein
MRRYEVPLIWVLVYEYGYDRLIVYVIYVATLPGMGTMRLKATKMEVEVRRSPTIEGWVYVREL